MALTKGATSLASAVTTTTTTSAVDVSDSLATVGVKVVQVGTASTACSFKIEVSLDGGTDYYTHAEAAAGTAAGTYTWTIDLPVSATHVRLANTAQSGGTSSTTDAEVGETTGSL